MRATLWQVLNVPNLPSIHCSALPLAALLELKCVDRQRSRQTRALELLYSRGGAVGREECEEHLPLSPTQPRPPTNS